MRNPTQIKRTIVPILKAHDVTRASLFGSTVADSRGEDSDIDLLVELADGKSLFDLIRLKRDLEEALEAEVDLVTYDSLHPLLADKILKQKKDIL